MALSSTAGGVIPSSLSDTWIVMTGNIVVQPASIDYSNALSVPVAEPKQIVSGSSVWQTVVSVIDWRYDSNLMQQERLWRINTERGVMKRNPYQLDSRLNTTAQARADFLRDTNQVNNKLMHDRTPATISKKDWTWNYSYTEMKDRFASYDIYFTSKGTAFTEIVGRGPVSCAPDISREQCTKRVINATNTTMDFFLWEKKRNGVHYRALVNNSFDRIGVWVAINREKGRYRFVWHVSGPIAE